MNATGGRKECRATCNTSTNTYKRPIKSFITIFSVKKYIHLYEAIVGG